MALLASGTYLEDKDMAVMNPMGGGIDTDVQNRMMQLRNDPNALGQQAQKSGDILDLIAARRAADLVAEQKKMLALQMNGSPATVKDQVEKELIDGQKAEMRGPLQSLQDKTQGVAGVLQNQQRQQQQQGRGQPQGQPMRAAMGGIINAPAPNLNRMYNGGIVGYAGEEGSEVSSLDAYLKELKIPRDRLNSATPEELTNISIELEKLVQRDRNKGAGLLAENTTGGSNFMPDMRSKAVRADDRERSASTDFVGQPKQRYGEEVISPPTFDTNVREAERLRDLESFDLSSIVNSQNEANQQLKDEGIAKAEAEEQRLAPLTDASNALNNPIGTTTGGTPITPPITTDATTGGTPPVKTGIETVVNPPGNKEGELSPEGQRLLEMQEAVQAKGVKDTPEG